MAKKTNVKDPVEESALEIVKAEQTQAEIEKYEKEHREGLIAQAHRMIGRIEAFSLVSKMSDVASAITAKQIKESNVYNELPGIGSWEDFCKAIGTSKSAMDEKIKNLDVLGVEFLELTQHFSLRRCDLRKLRASATDGTIIIDAEKIRIGDEEIPIDEDHKEDLQAAIESVIDAKEKEIEEQKATVAAKEKVLAAKEKVIRGQEKELRKFQGDAKKKGYKPGEEEFLVRMEAFKKAFDALIDEVDPESVFEGVEDRTPRMEAALVEATRYAHQVSLAYIETAEDMFGLVPDLQD